MPFFKRKRKNTSKVVRLLRSFVSVVVLTAFILVVTMTIKGLSGLNRERIVSLSKPFATRVGIDETKIGDVAGYFVARLGSTDVTPVEASRVDTNRQVVINRDSKLRIAIFADSHNDDVNLGKAVKLAKDAEVDAIIHLGDVTNIGLVENLTRARILLEDSGLPFYVIPGDRDLRVTHELDRYGLGNFSSVFGKDYHYLTVKDVQLLVVNNAANYSPVPEEAYQKFLEDIKFTDFVFLSQPLYYPSKETLYGNKVMGLVDGEEQPVLRAQAEQMLSAIRSSRVKAVISAEHHHSSSSRDPLREGLEHIVVGAITSTINDWPQKAIQSPRFSVLYVYDDGTFLLEEILL